eukprot:GHVU01169528.1.p2 GENE.GHVU01169528.1~~GHVU01169528.1.p2  ORF type:complete len:106 (-),score=2.25 GHVU01169528.1:596-913(-)
MHGSAAVPVQITTMLSRRSNSRGEKTERLGQWSLSTINECAHVRMGCNHTVTHDLTYRYIDIKHTVTCAGNTHTYGHALTCIHTHPHVRTRTRTYTRTQVRPAAA